MGSVDATAIVYVRNSSGKQASAGTHEGQLLQANATAARLGATVVAVYADRGISAKSGNLAARGDFARLCADLPAVKPDLCIVANVDRLTRTELFEEIGAIWGPLQKAGVRVATAGGQVLDLSTPEGQLLAMFESWRAARENAARRDRTIAGRLRAVREGRNPGRHPYGYRFDGKRVSVPHAAVVRWIYWRAATGWSCETIAGALNRRRVVSPRIRRWSTSTVADIIRPRRPNGDPYVTGIWIAQRGEPPIAVPAIVTPERAAKARAMLAGRTRKPPTATKHVNFLDEGAAVCGICGAPIRLVQCHGRVRKDGSSSRFAYYGCERRVKARAIGCEPCPLPLRRVELVDAAVWARVQAAIDAPAAVARAAGALADGEDQVAADLAEAERDLAADRARLDALLEALGSGAITAEQYRAQAGRIAARRDLLEHQVATWRGALEGAAQSEPSPAARAELRMEVRRLTAEADRAAQRDLVRRLWPLWMLDETGVEAIRSGDGIGEPIRIPGRIRAGV